MNCCDQGKLMAYLDRQLSPEEMESTAAHLSSCSGCRELGRQLAVERDQAAELLETYRQAAESVPVAAGGGKENLQTRGVSRMTGSGNGKWRKWVAGVAAVAVLSGLFALAPVRSFASQLLQVFRVNQVQVLHFNPQDVQALEQSLNEYGKDIKTDSFGTVSREEVSDYRQIDANTVSILGQTSTLPEKLGTYRRASGVELNPGEKLTIKPKVAGINALLSNMGSKQLLPQSLDGKTFTVEVPPTATATYIDNDGRSLTLYRTVAPKITVPDGVDVNAVRAALLGIPALPDDIRSTLAGIKDWGNTMLVPDFGYGTDATTEELTVNGGEGVYFSRKESASQPDDPAKNDPKLKGAAPNVLLWPAQNIWTGISGSFTKAQALDLAASLR